MNSASAAIPNANLGARDPERLVRRGHHDPATGEMLVRQPRELPLGARVESGGRLVEQPDRAMADQQSGDRGAALLAGGEIAERQMADAGEPDLFERLFAG